MKGLYPGGETRLTSEIANFRVSRIIFLKKMLRKIANCINFRVSYNLTAFSFWYKDPSQRLICVPDVCVQINLQATVRDAAFLTEMRRKS